MEWYAGVMADLSKPRFRVQTSWADVAQVPSVNINIAKYVTRITSNAYYLRQFSLSVHSLTDDTPWTNTVLGPGTFCLRDGLTKH